MGMPAARLTRHARLPDGDCAGAARRRSRSPAPAAPTVLIGGMPAAGVGDMAVCIGPPDVIALGSFTVLIGGQPAARLGDMTAHGGTIVLGCPTVLIG